MDPEKVHVILNVYDPPTAAPRPATEVRQELQIPEQSLVVGIIASFDAEKNHSLFLRFAEAVLRHRTDVVFLCIGDGSERPDREAEAARYGITEQVRFLGMRRDVNDLLGVMDVSVNCSVREGLCNAIIESIAAGVPILASRVGGTPEIVREGRHGVLFPSNDVTEMTRGFFEMTEDLPAYRTHIAGDLPALLTSMSPDRIARQLFDFYRNLLGAGQTSPPTEGEIRTNPRA
jgi:glycosyltransferase involved in cell wall biosynthesis